jgi:hypothetical protein
MMNIGTIKTHANYPDPAIAGGVNILVVQAIGKRVHAMGLYCIVSEINFSN